MTDTASRNQTSKPSPVSGDSGELPADKHPLPVQDEQSTVISHRPPMPTPPLSDSACRILQGEILPGDRLEHFELVEYVGGGGMGRVFRGVDTRLQRIVALKILPPEQAADEETRLRFQNEAQSAARLDHENIARVYHVGEDQGLHYIVFEFIEGVNIRRLVERKGPLPVPEAVSYTLQVADALAHADTRNIVHRDVKPSNVLITPEGQVKLIDMGLARLRRLDTAAADLTASGVTLGTFDYIAPEQARDPREADIRSDIYSLGCTFFYMLTGQPPFPEGTVLQKLLKHQGDQPPDIRRFRPDLPDEAARVLRKMLAKDPRHRYRDSAELVEELMLLAHQLGLRPAGRAGKALVAPREPTISYLQRHLPWIAPIAALVCIVMVYQFFFSGQGDAEPPWPDPPPVAEKGAAKPPADDPGGKPLEDPGDDPQPRRKEVAKEPPGPESDAEGGTAPEPKVSDEPTAPARAGPPSPLITGHSAGGGLELEPSRSGMSVGREAPLRLDVASDAEAASGQLTGATGAAAEPRELGPPPAPVPERTGRLVVKEQAQGENEFSTLQAACRMAASGSVIELCYDGRREEQPITLANLSVTIRAGKGYHPVVVFRPEDTDPVKSPRSMFTVTGGRLTLANLAVELHLRRDVPAETWSLFETRGSQTVRLESCSLSIYNASDQLAAYHPEVAFFRTRSAPDAEVVGEGHSLAATPPAVIDLVDCIARGEARFLCATELQPVHLIWKNGLLVTTEQLSFAYGGQQPPQPGEMLQIDLRHLTAVVRGGLCRMTQTLAAPYQLNTQIYCGDSILVSAPGAPLIDQEGIDTLEDLRQQVAWVGERNFYEKFDVFWTVRNLDQEGPHDPMTFVAWQSYWGSEDESLPATGSVGWKKLPDSLRPLHAHTPADYTPAEATPSRPNPAQDAGFEAEKLPELPPPPRPPEPVWPDTPD